MKKINILLDIVLVLICVQGFTQNIINSNSDFKNSAYLRTGIEPATMFALGYEHKFAIPLIKSEMALYGEAKFSIIKLKNKEFKVGGVLPIYEKWHFKVINNLNLSCGSVSTVNFDSKKFAVADEVAFGLYRTNWFVALTAEYEKIYLNYLEHSDFYRTTYYEDAVDGWYKGAGGSFQFGLEVGKTFKSRYDVNFEFKMPMTEKFNGFLSPAHANLSFGYKF